MRKMDVQVLGRDKIESSFEKGAQGIGKGLD